MRCNGRFNLNEATRRSWYNPDFVLQDLHSNMVFMDIGCGDGFFSILAAKKVGKNGKVYAIDSDASAIEKLKQKSKNEGLENITAKVGNAEDTVFCKQCADLILYCMDLHDFKNPKKVLQNAREMIKTDGVVVDLDWKKVEGSIGPPVDIRFSEEKVAELMRSEGFKVTDIISIGLYHYLITAKP